MPLLVVFYAVLGLGFQGKFTLDGTGAREALMQAIDERLERGGVRNSTGPVVIASDQPCGWQGLSLLAWVGVTLIGAGVIYFALDRWLAASIARLGG